MKPVQTFQPLLLAGVVAGLVSFACVAQAQSSHDHHAAPAAGPTQVAQSAAGEMSEGEVRKVDAAGRKITLKHGPLKNLDMPAMTMAFEVADPKMLAQVKAGEKVRFVAANPGGKLTITKLEPAK